MMAAMFASTVGPRREPGKADDKDSFILGWLYRLDDDFVHCVRDKQPLGLVTLSFYAVLLYMMEQEHWWSRGWATHILQTIRRVLPKDFHDLLRWPLDEVLQWGVDAPLLPETDAG